MLKRTPLFQAHQKLGARLVEFGGWEMPVQYTSIVDEHRAVRTAAGIFDISHMGELLVSGPGALSFLNRLFTNDLRRIEPGQGQYTLMCNERGGVVDDLYAYRLADQEFLLIINASRIEADVSWIQSQIPPHPDFQFQNASDFFGAVAVQGPRVAAFIDACFPSAATQPSTLKKNQLTALGGAGERAWIARTGYTGEDGFEVVAPASRMEVLWNSVLETGTPHGLKPAGLGARDTLRTEVCYPLYGHELDEQTTPIEAGLGFFVALDKPDFIGRSVLADQKANGSPKRAVAFRMAEQSPPPRPGYPIWGENSVAPIGQVVSGTQSPTLNAGIGLGYVPPDSTTPGTVLAIEIRGKRFRAEVVRKPFYKKAV
jgi:aminomethyltransferase